MEILSILLLKIYQVSVPAIINISCRNWKNIFKTINKRTRKFFEIGSKPKIKT